MVKHLVTLTVRVGLAVLAAITLGCGGESPFAPSQPAALSVTAISPNTGSSGGASSVRITGTGFQSGATVTVDGVAIVAPIISATFITVVMPAHAAGTVDVVVTNPAGQGVRVPGGYTYVLTPLSVTKLAPNAVSTGGGAWVVITGTGFQSGATVSIDGSIASRVYNPNNGTVVHVQTDAHAAGTVDLVVTNPDGHTVRVPQGVTYASPGSIDFNGDWQGSVDELESPHVIRFRIQNNVLVSISVTCGTSNLTFSPPATVSNGEFSVAGNGGGITGRILSADRATGTHNMAACPGTLWDAYRQ